MPRLRSVLGAAMCWSLLGVGAPAWAAQPSTWNFTQARIPGAQEAGRLGSGVTVAVVDTWVDGGHPDFGGRVLAGADCVGGCRSGRASADACGHGTHVAGTIASRTYGVAPAARILAVRVLSYDPSSGNCSGTATDVAAGIGWAADHGAQVVNLSLGGLVPGLSQSSAVTSAVRAAAARGVVVVFAAGNSTVPLTDNYGTDALLVAATGPGGQIATYSQRGSAVSLAAPGGDDGAAGLAGCGAGTCIASTWLRNGYALDEGTSMAAPHVSGIAALLLSQQPSRGRADVLNTLESTAQPIPEAGHGLVDATAALQSRKGAPPGESSQPASQPASPPGSQPTGQPPLPAARAGGPPLGQSSPGAQPTAPAGSPVPAAGTLTPKGSSQGPAVRLPIDSQVNGAPRTRSGSSSMSGPAVLAGILVLTSGGTFLLITRRTSKASRGLRK